MSKMSHALLATVLFLPLAPAAAQTIDHTSGPGHWDPNQGTQMTLGGAGSSHTVYAPPPPPPPPPYVPPPVVQPPVTPPPVLPPPPPAVYIKSAAPGTATKGKAYSFTFSTTGGTGTKTFSLTVGNPPTGIKLASTGKLSGTPTATGTWNFTVKVTDAAGKTDTQANTIKVVATPPASGTWSYGQCRVGSWFDDGTQCTTSGGSVMPGQACSPIGAQGYYTDVEEGGNMTTVTWKSVCM